MTRLHVLGSGSKGNAFVLETSAGVLLVEAGFGPRAIRRRMAEAGLHLAGSPGDGGGRRLLGIVLTHEHGDHAAGAAALAAAHRAPIVCTAGTWEGLGAPASADHVRLAPARPLAFEGFTIHSCLTTHDATEPVALVTETPDGHRIGFAMDLGRSTTAIRWLMREANALLLESNYDEVMLRTGRYPPSVQQRIAGAGGHLSNRAAAALAADLVHPGLSAVVLVHLSQQCNSPGAARATVEPVLRSRRFAGDLHVAEQDSVLPPIPVRGAPGRDQGELALAWAPKPALSGR